MNTPELKKEIIRFLKENGWSQQLSKEGDVVRFQIKDQSFNRPINIYFTESLIDDLDREREITEAITIIRQYYGINVPEMRGSMFRLYRSGLRGIRPRDLVTSTVPDRYVTEDTIDVSIASSMISYMKGLLAGAAVAEFSLWSFERPAEIRAAKTYAKGCKFGHTFRGSFGFQVECPLEENSQLDFFAIEKPLGRKVSERIALSLTAITQAFETDDIRILLNSGATARICSETAEFLDSTGISSFHMGVMFDEKIRADLSGTDNFKLTIEAVPMLREAAAKLSPAPFIEEAANIVGRIIELKASGIPLSEDDPTKRIITVQWYSDEGIRKIRIELAPHQYADAIRAHERGHIIQIRGILTYSGKYLMLKDHGEIAILE